MDSTKQALDFFTIRDDIVKIVDIQSAVQETMDSAKQAYSLMKFDKIKQPQGEFIVRVEASHLGFVNGNFKFYRGKHAMRSKRTWTTPRNKPVLKFHNITTGEPIGTIAAAEIDQFSDFTDWSIDIRRNKPQGVLRLYARINDEDAMQKFLDGRYNGVSINATPTGGVFCSITGKNLMTMGSEERWDHIMQYRPGSVHMIKNKKTDEEEERLCYWAYEGLDYIELSVVNMPADANSKVTGVNMPAGDSLEFDTKDDLALAVHKQEEKTKPFFISGLAITDTINYSQESNPMNELSLKDLLERKDIRDHIDQVVKQHVSEAKAPLIAKNDELTKQVDELTTEKIGRAHV